MGIQKNSFFPFINSVLCSLLEKNRTLDQIISLKNPNKPITKLFKVGSPPCLNLISIPIIYSEGKVFLQVYQFETIKKFTPEFLFFSVLQKREKPFGNISNQENTFFSRDSIVDDIEPVIKTPSHETFFSRNDMIFQIKIIKNVLLTIMRKAEHIGVTSHDIERLIGTSTFRFLSRLQHLVKITMPHWILSQTLSPIVSRCTRKGFFLRRYPVLDFYFGKIFHTQGVPCQHCPLRSECVPQGNVNPFECLYMKFWETDY